MQQAVLPVAVTHVREVVRLLVLIIAMENVIWGAPQDVMEDVMVHVEAIVVIIV